MYLLFLTLKIPEKIPEKILKLLVKFGWSPDIQLLSVFHGFCLKFHDFMFAF